MGSIIIPSTRSLTLTNKIPDGNITKDNISVGDDGVYTYSSFLFFDISTIPSNAEITNAEIVLFKTDNFYENKKKCIYIYPLLDYFSNYTTYNNQPKVNHLIEGSLYPLTPKISATANLTKIVSLWFKNAVSNKGLILCKKNNNFITSFGSATCKDSNLIPFIKVIYSIKNNIVIHENHTSLKIIYYPCPCNCNPNPGIATTRQVRVIGIVAPMSIYEAVISLAVTRWGTGHIDNYHVTDEYNNSTSSTPLPIDKFYNIAILPQSKPGDTENVVFYGSYKGNIDLFI